MVEGGLSPLEVIAAATSGAAQALGLQEEVGVVVPGMVADLAVVEGDPLADIQVLGDRALIWLVVQAGRPVAGRPVEGGQDGWTCDLRPERYAGRLSRAGQGGQPTGTLPRSGSRRGPTPSHRARPTPRSCNAGRLASGGGSAA